jgi:hypothetical protein
MAGEGMGAKWEYGGRSYCPPMLRVELRLRVLILSVNLLTTVDCKNLLTIYFHKLPCELVLSVC